MIGVTYASLALGSAVVAFCAAVHGAVGIGFALIAVPILALIDTTFVPGPMLVAALVLSCIMAWRGRGFVDTGELALSGVGLVLGSIAGSVALGRFAGDDLPIVLAGLVLAAVAISVLGVRVPITRTSLLATSTTAGFMGTMAGFHGPPMALLYQHQEPARVRAVMGAFFVAAGAISLAALAAIGLFGWRHVLLGLALAPGTVAGYAAAPLLARVLDRGLMRWAILAVSATSAVALLLKG